MRTEIDMPLCSVRVKWRDGGIDGIFVNVDADVQINDGGPNAMITIREFDLASLDGDVHDSTYGVVSRAVSIPIELIKTVTIEPMYSSQIDLARNADEGVSE